MLAIVAEARRCTGLAAFAACALLPATAVATNGTHPRTPVLWDADAPCVQVHDRSQGATLHLPYAIPLDDVEITPDEVADSRRHQFFAFCRPHDAQAFLPSWITDADVQSAAAKDLLTVDQIEPTDILEHSTAWADCWHRIVADDDRRPIDAAHANAGVDWDTSGLPIGGYTLYGYTYEPVFNLWWLRPTAVKLHDGDPEAAGPVGVIATGALSIYRDETVRIEGGVDAVAGTTFEVAWALTADTDGEPVWTVIDGTHEIQHEYFAFDFTPPEPMWGTTGMLRVVFTDPGGRSSTTYQADLIEVIGADDPSSCNGGGFIGTPCDEGGEPPSEDPLRCALTRPPGSEPGSSSDAGTGDTEPPPGAAPATPDSDGCSCSAEDSRGSLLWIAFIVARARRRRR